MAELGSGEIRRVTEATELIDDGSGDGIGIIEFIPVENVDADFVKEPGDELREVRELFTGFGGDDEVEAGEGLEGRVFAKEERLIIQNLQLIIHILHNLMNVAIIRRRSPSSSSACSGSRGAGAARAARGGSDGSCEIAPDRTVGHEEGEGEGEERERRKGSGGGKRRERKGGERKRRRRGGDVEKRGETTRGMELVEAPLDSSWIVGTWDKGKKGLVVLGLDPLALSLTPHERWAKKTDEANRTLLTDQPLPDPVTTHDSRAPRPDSHNWKAQLFGFGCAAVF